MLTHITARTENNEKHGEKLVAMVTEHFAFYSEASAQSLKGAIR